MNCKFLSAVLLLLALVFGGASTTCGDDRNASETQDLTPLIEAFGRAADAARRNRNELQLEVAHDDFSKAIAAHAGKKVRCEFAVLKVYTDRVLFVNPILSTRYRFVFYGGDAAALVKDDDINLQFMYDIVSIDGVSQPGPLRERIAKIAKGHAASLNTRDRVVVVGELSLPKFADQRIDFVNASVIPLNH